MNKTAKIITALAIVCSITVASIATGALAFGGPDGPGGPKGEPDPEQAAHREALQEAVANNDYDTWYSLVKEKACNPPILEQITAENFYLFNELHQAKEDGDMQRAKEIAEELGIKGPKGLKKGIRKQNMKKHMQEMIQYIESGDYQGWYDFMTQDGRTPPLVEKINEDNFYLLGELHQAKQNGDFERAKEIAEELGLEKPQFMQGNQGNHFGQYKNRFGGEQPPAELPQE